MFSSGGDPVSGQNWQILAGTTWMGGEGGNVGCYLVYVLAVRSEEQESSREAACGVGSEVRGR